jgi:phage terminase small subunit
MGNEKKGKRLPRNERKLSDKQERFCLEYVKDSNGTQSAIRAGYSERTANEQASRMLAKVNIQERVAELQAEIAKRNKISIDECVGLLTSMARFDIASMYDEEGGLLSIHDMPPETRLVITELSTFEEFETNLSGQKKKVGETKKLKVSDRRANIIELMKHLGGYEKDNNQKTVVLNDDDRETRIKALEAKINKNKNA